MQNVVKTKNQGAAERPKNEGRESSFLRTAKKAARRNADALRELAKH